MFSGHRLVPSDRQGRNHDQNTEYTGPMHIRKPLCCVALAFLLISSNVSLSAPISRTQRIDLQPGYNLISIQVGTDAGIPVDDVVAAINTPGEVIGIWGYELWAEPWDGDVPEALLDAATDILRVYPGHGYLVQLSEAGVIEITAPTWEGSVVLNAGWNLIGFPGLASDKPYVYELSSVFGSSFDQVNQIQALEGGLAPKVVRYDAVSSPPITDLTNIQPGLGYWIFSTETMVLIPEPSVSVVVDQELFDAQPNEDATSISVSETVDTQAELTSSGEAAGTIVVQDGDTIQFASNADKRTLIIENVGSGLINWSIEEDADWLDVEASFGTVSSVPAVVDLTVNRLGLSVGTHNATMIIHTGSTDWAIDLIVEPALASAPLLEATTNPVGYTTLKLKSDSLNFVGLNMVRSVVHQGWLRVEGMDRSVASLFVDEIDQDSKFDLEQSQFDGEPTFLEIRSGSFAGWHSDIIATDGTSDSIRLKESLPGDIDDSVRYVIRRHWTIGSVFGQNNESGLKSGNDITADQILLLDTNTGVYRQIYYSDDASPFGSGVGWREVDHGLADRSTEVLPFVQGILIQARSPADKQIRLVGAVKVGQTRLQISQGVNLISNIDASGGQTLGGLGLVPGLGTGSDLVADAVLIPVAVGQDVSYDHYFYSTGDVFGTPSGWQKVGVIGDQADTVLPIGASYLIERRGLPTQVTVAPVIE